MRIRFREQFSNRHVILPVIHVESTVQAVRNTQIAMEEGCDGAFLINHGVSHEELMDTFRTVRTECPNFWLGVNSLGCELVDFIGDLPSGVQGVWTDNAGIDEQAVNQATPIRVCKAIAGAAWPGLYFGGVAFKYQRNVSDVASAARIAAQYMDVVTTSGPGTGHAASIEKIRAMKEAMGGMPLALASGVTPENVIDFLPWVDAYLVATGISRSFSELEPKLVRSLVRIVRNWTC